MGAKLAAIFREAEKMSLNAKMRLVMLTSITSLLAEETPDTPELVAKFEEALKRIKQEENK